MATAEPRRRARAARTSLLTAAERPPHRHHAHPLPHLADAAALRDLLDRAAVQPVFQPMVDLTTGGTRAYEALARGPRGHRLEAPDALFGAARASGLLPALDAICVAAALESAGAGGLRWPWTLFINIEPDSHSIDVLPGLAGAASAPIVVELTERALADDPAEVLATVALIRRLGWGVALDDVGVDPDSLALLPLIAPDVIKLDASMVQLPPSTHTAHVFSAVAAEVERSGCLVVAEGIETPAHLHAARALGAHLGQGWLFGRPGRLPAAPADPAIDPLPLCRAGRDGIDSTPFTAASRDREVRASTKPLLLAMSKHIEQQAVAIGESCLVLATFQTASAFAPAAGRYAELATDNAYVAVFGAGLEGHPVPGVRGVDLHPHEPLSREWSLVIVGPHYAAVLAAQQIDEDGGEDTHWNYVLSHERRVVVRAAATLMNRITRDCAPPSPSGTEASHRAR